METAPELAGLAFGEGAPVGMEIGGDPADFAGMSELVASRLGGSDCACSDAAATSAANRINAVRRAMEIDNTSTCGRFPENTTGFRKSYGM